MPLSEQDAKAVFNDLMDTHMVDCERMRVISDALSDDTRQTWLPAGTPADVRKLARISRVNFLKLIVKSCTQSLFVDGYRSTGVSGDLPVWQIWQLNRMNKRQIGIHSSAVKYGVSYATVLPGEDSIPVIRGVSPTKMSTLYEDIGDDWPVYALEKRRTSWRLYDESHVYTFMADPMNKDATQLMMLAPHGAPETPVVRFTDNEDLECPIVGQVEPYLTLQEQINFTTFGLFVAQHFGAFKQRYVLGWLAESEEQELSASAKRMLTFEDSPSDIQVGEFSQTQLDGYIASREATLRQLSTISQTPAHELLGQLVNLSAEALAVAEASRTRLQGVMKATLGESWEQVLDLSGQLASPKIITDPFSWIWWRDTEVRSLGTVADALGKMATMLGIPQQELWEHIPGVSMSEVEHWKEMAALEPQPVEDVNS